MRNYFYLYGSGDTARLFFVDARRNARVVAAGSLWTARPDVGAFHGVGGVPTLLPLHSC